MASMTISCWLMVVDWGGGFYTSATSSNGNYNCGEDGENDIWGCGTGESGNGASTCAANGWPARIRHRPHTLIR